MSTYLQYNNHMILHPTDSSKYLSELIEPVDEVTIGTQTWKMHNVTLDDGLGGIYTSIMSFGHGDQIVRYYTWDAAVRIAAKFPGWHLPTKYEWQTLVDYVGGSSVAGTKLKSTFGWPYGGAGTDDYGFEALPTGSCEPVLDEHGQWSSWIFAGEWIYTYYWSATEGEDTLAEDYAYMIDLHQIPNALINYTNKDLAFQLRLIKGDTPPEPQYTITIGTSSHGSVSASTLSATAGTTITLTATPDTDYQLDYFTLNGIAIVGNSFVMPSSDVTVSAVFVATSPSFDTVTIGSQTWMSKNLAIDDGQGGIYSRDTIGGTQYYYTWDAAVRVAATVQGWHLPTAAEWDTLSTTVGSNPGTKLKSTYGWLDSNNGTDDYGFSALPVGARGTNGSYYNTAQETSFWTSVQYSTSDARSRYFNTGTAMNSYITAKATGYSVRLIKDQQ